MGPVPWSDYGPRVAHAESDRPIDVADIRRHRPEVLAEPGSPHPEAYTDDGSYEEALLAFRDQLVLGRLSRFRNNVHAAAASLEDRSRPF